MQNLSYENEPVGGTHFYVNGSAGRLGLRKKQKPTQKWPISHLILAHHFALAVVAQGI